MPMPPPLVPSVASAGTSTGSVAGGDRFFRRRNARIAAAAPMSVTVNAPNAPATRCQTSLAAPPPDALDGARDGNTIATDSPTTSNPSRRSATLLSCRSKLTIDPANDASCARTEVENDDAAPASRNVYVASTDTLPAPSVSTRRMRAGDATTEIVTDVALAGASAIKADSSAATVAGDDSASTETLANVIDKTDKMVVPGASGSMEASADAYSEY